MLKGEYIGSAGGIDARVLGVVIDNAARTRDPKRVLLIDPMVESYVEHTEGGDNLASVNQTLEAYGNHVGAQF